MKEKEIRLELYKLGYKCLSEASRAVGKNSNYVRQKIYYKSEFDISMFPKKELALSKLSILDYGKPLSLNKVENYCKAIGITIAEACELVGFKNYMATEFPGLFIKALEFKFRNSELGRVLKKIKDFDLEQLTALQLNIINLVSAKIARR